MVGFVQFVSNLAQYPLFWYGQLPVKREYWANGYTYINEWEHGMGRSEKLSTNRTRSKLDMDVIALAVWAIVVAIVSWVLLD